MKHKLWTKNYTIITLGTVVSMLGSSISNFAIALMVLDYTDSLLLYSLFLIAYRAPGIIMPLVIGPVIDKYSRVKMIYGLDFLSSAIYMVMFILIFLGHFSYVPFLFAAIGIGAIDGTYRVAYDSLYPTLISEGNYAKAYSISSMIEPLAAVMVPVAAILYETVGLSLLFLINAVSFLLAAIAETQIKTQEKHIKSEEETPERWSYVKEFKQGMSYIRSEKGLLLITAFSFVLALALASNTLTLPYFKSSMDVTFTLFGREYEVGGVIVYTFVMAFSVIGRLLGGLLHYKIQMPSSRRYLFLIIAGLGLFITDGVFLYTPIWSMVLLCLFSGILTATVFNIRASTTQSYVPNEYRGRFNGTFQMICMMGTLSGQFFAGVMGDFLQERMTIMIFWALVFVAVLAIIIPGKKHVKPICNQDI